LAAKAMTENQTFGVFGAEPVAQPASAAQAAVTLTSTNGTAAAAEDLAALKAECENIGDDVRSLSTLVHALRTALISTGLIKGSA
jgi:hypothetical protein